MAASHITTSSGTVRVAVLSDTHGYVCPNVLEVIGTCDLAVHAGDLGSARVLQRLQEATGEVFPVRGNNDVPGLWAGDELEVLGTVPRVARAIVFGHTHMLLVDCEDDPWVLNPGAVGRVPNRGAPSCLVLHAGPDAWRVEEFKFGDSGPIRRSRGSPGVDRGARVVEGGSPLQRCRGAYGRFGVVYSTSF